jgi:hypothetical protein
LIAAYAAVLEPQITGLTLHSPPATHMDKAAPQFLNVLRVCDVPDAVGLIAPRPLAMIAAEAAQFRTTAAAYQAANASKRLQITP